MTSSLLPPDLLARTLDVLERLPDLSLPATALTEAQLRACVQAHCQREGLTVTPEDLDHALRGHLQAHPLVRAPVASPTPAPFMLPARIAWPRGWRRPRTAWGRWLRQHSPVAGWRALTDRMRQGRTSDVFWYAYALAAIVWAPVWFFPVLLPAQLAAGAMCGLVATLLAGTEAYTVARSMQRMGHRWGFCQPDPLANAGEVREQDLARWQDTPAALAHVQACLHSRIPRLLVGDVRHIQRLRERLQQAKHLTQQQTQVAKAIEKTHSAA